ncbi:universal stress protein [Streptomyces flavofungini]|uniref:Universal stress protein n=2 Tax=Streptomyces flavofungini TaxID=68200 RepID=A0ABS0XHE5_9ACTN|nr:universal stress protein [Streptomyces flavofungini]
MTTSAPPPIVVGIDADAPALMALAWGADDAHRRHLPLRVVLALGQATNRHPTGPGCLRRNLRDHSTRSAAEHALCEAVAFVQRRQPELKVSTLLVTDPPVPALLQQARTATSVVLGSRQSSGRAGLVATAAVALPVVARAACPVVVVPEHECFSRRQPFFVVGADVGWDGCRHSAAAVHHAFEEAARHGAKLKVLHVWHPPLLGFLDERAALRECHRLLSGMVAGWRVAHPEVDVQHVVRRGHPVQVLAQESAHALALVVGTRGQSRATGPLRGSVVSGTVRHAQCPVVAVPRLDTYRRRTHMGRRVNWLSLGARKAVERYARLLIPSARARLRRVA